MIFIVAAVCIQTLMVAMLLFHFCRSVDGQST